MIHRVTLLLTCLAAFALPASAQFGAKQETGKSTEEIQAERAYRMAVDLSLGGGEFSPPEITGLDLERSAQLLDGALDVRQRYCDDRTRPTDQWARNCKILGDFYRKGIAVEQDYAQAKIHYEAACYDGKIAQACVQQAFLDHKGQGSEQNRDDAFKLYKQACDLGNPRGCAGYGHMLYFGQGAEADRNEGRRVLQQACVDDDAWACERLRDLGLPEYVEAL